MLCEGEVGWQTMAHEIPRDENALNDAARDLTALTDQWFDKNWYLPPGGDQSWREREAERLFGGHAEQPSGDTENPPPVEQGEMDRADEPGFRRARNVMLPLSLAACTILLVGAVAIFRLLPSGIWGPHEPKTLPVTPVRMMTEAAATENARLRPAYEGGSNRVTYNDVSQALPQPIGQAAAPTDQEIALPSPRPAAAIKQDQPSDKPIIRTAKAQSPAAPGPGKRVAKPSPPIGEAYFASHASAAAAGKPIAVSRPIGQAYFEGHSPAIAD